MTITLRLIKGDCLKYLPSIPDKSVDLVLTDPPYNVGKDYGNDYNDKRYDYFEWCKMWFKELKRISNLVVFTCGTSNLAEWCCIEKPLWIACRYVSNACSISKLGGVCVWEPILVYGKLRKKAKRDAWDIPIALQRDIGDHPAPKSFNFWKVLVEEFSIKHDTVLDPFLGSGTTMKACIELERNCIGIEINKGYTNFIKSRLNWGNTIDNSVEWEYKEV